MKDATRSWWWRRREGEGGGEECRLKFGLKYWWFGTVVSVLYSTILHGGLPSWGGDGYSSGTESVTVVSRTVHPYIR
jgi:hypothetical protein